MFVLEVLDLLGGLLDGLDFSFNLNGYCFPRSFGARVVTVEIKEVDLVIEVLLLNDSRQFPEAGVSAQL